MVDTVRVVSYTLNPDNRYQIFALIDDSSEYFQVYVGDASTFSNYENTDISAIKWTKYTNQPMLRVSKYAGVTIRMTYAYNRLVIKDPIGGRLIVLPSDDTPYNIKFPYQSVSNEDAKELDDFFIVPGGGIYMGGDKGIYHYIDHIWQPKLLLKTSSFPSLIFVDPKSDLLVVVVNNVLDYVYITRISGINNEPKWEKVGLHKPGQVYEVVVDYTNYVIHLITKVPDPSPSELSKVLVNCIYYKAYAQKLGPLQSMEPYILLNTATSYDGLSSRFISAQQDLDGLLVGVMDTNKAVYSSFSIEIISANFTYTVNKNYDVNVDFDEDGTQHDFVVSPDLSSLGPICALYLHSNSNFYIRPNTPAFKQLHINKIS